MVLINPHLQVDNSIRKRQRIPVLIRNGLYVMLVSAAIVSVPFLGRWGPLPTTAMLDAWVIIFISVCFIFGKTRTTVILIFLSLYLLGRVIPAVYMNSPAEDFLQAHRWIVYLIAFALAVGRDWGSTRGLVRVMWTLLSLALLKAALTFIVLGPGERPGLLLENNFEIALFAGLVVVLYRFLGRGQLWAVLLMGALTVLAGSRSGAVAFLLLAFFAISQAKRANMLVKYLLGLLAPALIMLPVLIFQQRSSGSGQIDRINFLDVFWDETALWGPWDWFFGTPPITPLSPAGCENLSYYSVLFSSENDGTCYSVILHAFLLRVIFDAGILGLLIAFGLTWLLMRRSAVPFGISATLSLIAFTNSMSVSGLNNPYVALPILLAILTATPPAVERQNHFPDQRCHDNYPT